MKILKLELSWIGKGERPKLEPRVLIEDPSKSYHARQRLTENDVFDNRLIFGDNLLALKALEQEFTGKVKCIYIDPPYNKGAAFQHYDDGIEHSIWLSLIRSRIELLYSLLSEDGSMWISIDDNECHYLKVLCDEIFHRSNYIATIIWQKKHTRANDARWFSDNHDFILSYAKNKNKWSRNLLPQTDTLRSLYKNPDHDSRGVWASGPCHAKTPNRKDIYEIVSPNGTPFYPPPGTSWRFSKERFIELIDDNRIYFGVNGSNVPRYKRFLTEVQVGIVPVTIWLKDEVGDNQEAKKEVKAFNSRDVFSTPKPERLIQRILHLSSKPGDLVLDSFAGSGTTGAVAHKMGRNWIMVELRDHCHTHIIPRMQKVIDGSDQGGISKTVDWKGGGGFRYYHLAPSLLEKDKWDNWIINKEYNKEMLAEALCKLEGFVYEPSNAVFWQHGHSTEHDFVYVTTQNLSQEQLRLISEEVGTERTLLILCSAFQGDDGQYDNLTIKKIPKHVLDKCEYGKDDYSLNVKNLPMGEKPEKQISLFDEGDLA